MNDDFLYRLREQPPQNFALALKARLDRQAYRQSKARSRYLRGLVIAVLLGGAAYAITIGSWRALRGTPAEVEPAQTAVESTDTATQPSARATLPPRATSDGAASTQPASANGSAAAPVSAAPLAQNAGEEGGAAAARGGSPSAARGERRNAGALLGETVGNSITIFGTSETAPYNEQATARLQPRPALRTIGDDEIGTLLCQLRVNLFMPAATVIASFTRIDQQTACDPGFRIEPDLAVVELKVGYEAIVLARSVLYGSVNLTPRALYLALAKDVPDRSGGPAVVPNRYRAWNEIDASIGYDRIQVLGPSLDSWTARRLLALLEVGCNDFPALAALAQSEPERHAEICGTLREDGVYEPIDGQVVERMQTYPTLFAVLPYDSFDRSRESLAAASIGGAAPTPADMNAGTYPASRTLYLYVIPGSRPPPTLAELLEAYLRLPDARMLAAAEEAEQRATRAKIAELRAER